MAYVQLVQDHPCCLSADLDDTEEPGSLR